MLWEAMATIMALEIISSVANKTNAPLRPNRFITRTKLSRESAITKNKINTDLNP